MGRSRSNSSLKQTDIGALCGSWRHYSSPTNLGNVITWDRASGYLRSSHDGYPAKILAVSKSEFIGYPTSFEVVIVLAGAREAAERCATPCCDGFIHLRVGTLLPRTPLLFSITVPPDMTSTLEERVVSAKIPVWGSIPNEVQILLAARRPRLATMLLAPADSGA
jgi:hypothetical protein